MQAWGLHREVLAAAEGAADPGEREPNLLGRELEALRDLAAVDVQPLRRDVEIHCPVLRGDGEARLGAEEGLVLHPQLVLAVDDDVGVVSAAATSPWRTWMRLSTLPSSWRRGSSVSIATSMSTSGSSSSYSTSISSAARRAVSGWSAATIATGWPW